MILYLHPCQSNSVLLPWSPFLQTDLSHYTDYKYKKIEHIFVLKGLWLWGSQLPPGKVRSRRCCCYMLRWLEYQVGKREVSWKNQKSRNSRTGKRMGSIAVFPWKVYHARCFFKLMIGKYCAYIYFCIEMIIIKNFSINNYWIS